jgi:hypothetical protein
LSDNVAKTISLAAASVSTKLNVNGTFTSTVTLTPTIKYEAAFQSLAKSADDGYLFHDRRAKKYAWGVGVKDPDPLTMSAE